MIELIELIDKKFKVVFINLFIYIKDLQENMNKMREMKDIKQLFSIEKNIIFVMKYFIDEFNRLGILEKRVKNLKIQRWKLLGGKIYRKGKSLNKNEEFQ